MVREMSTNFVYKPTKCVTNSKVLAEALDRRCSNSSHTGAQLPGELVHKGGNGRESMGERDSDIGRRSAEQKQSAEA